jgi:hypothetical protein
MGDKKSELGRTRSVPSAEVSYPREKSPFDDTRPATNSKPTATTSARVTRNEAPPPPYASIDGPFYTKECLEIKRRWDRRCPTNWAKTRWMNVLFHCAPEICQDRVSFGRLFRNRTEQPAWHATLRISATNVARLMAMGFKWSHENILEGHDRIVLDDPTLAAEDEKSCLWRHTRIYQLKDKVGEPEYKGVLHVHGKARETVLNFDPSQITTDTLIEAKAWDWDGNLVYYANKRSGHAFNKVYNLIPLKGWWPAPREPGKELKGWKLLPRY